MPRRAHVKEHAPPLQALLFWQLCLICGILGLLAPRWPEAAVLGLGLVFWADSRLHPLHPSPSSPQLPLPPLPLLSGRRLGLCAVALVCFFLAYYGHLQAMPQATILPAWAVPTDKAKTPPRLRAVVEKVQGLTDQRLRITLVNATLDSLPEGETLPGKLLWTWDKAPSRPVEGQTWAFSLPLTPITGFKNRGLADWSFTARSQDHQWRMWSKEMRGAPEILPQSKAQPAALKRETLRQSFMQILRSGDSPATAAPALTQAQAILPALLFGDRSALHTHTIELFTKATLVHSLALSGQHLAVTLLLAAGLIACVGRFHAPLFLHLPRAKAIMLCALPLALLYLWLGAAPASLQRAACMMGVLSLCLWRNTSMTTLDILCAAVLCLLVLNPLSVFDLGLQLSVVCVGSIGLMMPMLRSIPHFGLPDMGSTPSTRALIGQQCGTFARTLCCICAISCAIQIALLPLSLLLFHTASPWFFLNVLWLPVLGAVVLPLTVLALGLAALHLPAAAHLCTVVAVWPCEWLLRLLEWLSAKGLLDEILFLRPHWTALLGYTALLLAAALLWKRPRLSPASKRLALAGALLLLVGPLLRYRAEASPSVSLRMLDVGQGQALALELPHGKKFVIDGGGSPSPRFNVGQTLLSPTLTFNSPPRVTALINTHSHTDHLAGLLYLNKYFQVQDWQDNRSLVAGDQVLLSQHPRLILEVLHPPKDKKYSGENNNSLVLRLVLESPEGRHGLALIPGDVEHKAIADLLAQKYDLQADVLVLPHHGSKTSFSPALYDAVRPQIALVSYGAYNRYGCPAPKVIEALTQRHIRVFKSAEDGQVRLLWDISEGRIRLKKPVDKAGYSMIETL